MKRVLLISLMLPAALCAQVAARWVCDPARPVAMDCDVWRGETLRLEPSFTVYGEDLGLSAATASLLWTTNAAAGWWSKPAEIVTGSPDRVRGVFAPTDDCGAAEYLYFIRVETEGGASYRAYGTLAMRDSPGANPTNLPAPSEWPDLAGNLVPLLLPYLPPYAAYTNEAAARAAGDAALSNLVAVTGTNLQAQLDALASGGAAVTQRLDAAEAALLTTTQSVAGIQAALPGLATTQSVAAALAAIPPPSPDALRLVDPSGDWLQSLAGGTSTLWRVVRTYDQSRVDFTFSAGAAFGEMLYPTNAVYELHTFEGDGLIFPRVEVAPDAYSFELYMGPTGSGYTAGWKTGAVPTGGFALPLVIEPYGSGDYGAPTGTLTVSWHLLSVATNAVGTYATHTDLLNAVATLASTQGLAAAVAPLAPTNAPVFLNPSVSGGLTLRNVMPTNLVLRLFLSNDVILCEEIYP